MGDYNNKNLGINQTIADSPGLIAGLVFLSISLLISIVSAVVNWIRKERTIFNYKPENTAIAIKKNTLEEPIEKKISETLEPGKTINVNALKEYKRIKNLKNPTVTPKKHDVSFLSKMNNRNLNKSKFDKSKLDKKSPEMMI